MKALIALLALAASLNTFSHSLSEEVVTRLVKEDIYQYGGRLLGVRYVDSLDFVGCDSDKCTFDFMYEAYGSHGDFDYDLTCTGKLEFDLKEFETDIAKQECLDN